MTAIYPQRVLLLAGGVQRTNNESGQSVEWVMFGTMAGGKSLVPGPPENITINK